MSAEDCLDLAGVAVGDQFKEWLTIAEADRWPMPAASLQVIRGTATHISSWPGAEQGRYPTRIDVGRAVLYWDAPGPAGGEVFVEALVRLNRVDAPPAFPDSMGRVQQIWVATPAAGTPSGSGEPAGLVPRDRLPRPDPRPLDPGWAGAVLDVEFGNLG